jgi:uncharacterized protein
MTSVRSEARVTTTRAARYLGQLCKHFAHRVPTSHAETRGRVEFPWGVCALEAAGDLLILRAEAKDTPALAQVEDVVGSHLERFAFRHKPEIRWTRGASR